jgi:hypothetical protein
MLTGLVVRGCAVLPALKAKGLAKEEG